METKELDKKEVPERKISENQKEKELSKLDDKNILREQLNLVKFSPLESLREKNNQLIQESNLKKSGLTEDEKKKVKEDHPDWPDEVIDAIGSWNEYEIYHKAGLIYANINGRHCLIRPDLDLDYVDPKTGRTNRELMAEGRAPIDPKTDEKITLHHIGQKYDGPLAELTESEHSGNYSILHASNLDSWRNDLEKKNEYNNHQRPAHWRERAKE
jgi:FtsZ-binding cell division protein ZapB